MTVQEQLALPESHLKGSTFLTVGCQQRARRTELSECGEDDVHRAEKQLDEVTSKHVHHVDDVLSNKEAELLEV